jgi:hypothetical protein
MLFLVVVLQDGIPEMQRLTLVKADEHRAPNREQNAYNLE